MRDSPTIPIIQGLQARGAKIRAYDPQAMENAKAVLEDIDYCADAYATAEGATRSSGHGMERLPRARFRSREESPAHARSRRSAQRVRLNRMKALGLSYNRRTGQS